jgi:hypothetical protein
VERDKPKKMELAMAMAAILNFFNPSKTATHYGGYSYKVS